MAGQCLEFYSNETEQSTGQTHGAVGEPQKEVTLKERLEVREVMHQFRKGAIQDEERATEGRKRTV